MQLIWHITDDLRFEAEYMSGTLDVEGIKKFRRCGYSVLPSYFINDKVNLFFLFAQADPNRNVDEDSVINYAPGINIELDDNMYLKVDYYNVVSQDNNSLFAGKSYSEIRAALAIGF